MSLNMNVSNQVIGIAFLGSLLFLIAMMIQHIVVIGWSLIDEIREKEKLHDRDRNRNANQLGPTASQCKCGKTMRDE